MVENYSSGIRPDFCPGCGNFGIFAALTKAFTDLKLDKDNMLIVAGIGCSSTAVQAFSCYGIHSLHGRLLPVAMGAKLANNDLTVLGIGGDGDGYGIGSAHLIHVARRNIDMTYVISDNQTYGLTTGQTSPTGLIGYKTKSTPFGDIENPLNPIALAISAGATYVARGFSGEPAHLAELIKRGITHKGFALIDVYSPCVTFNYLNTYDWFKNGVYKLEGTGYDPKDKHAALVKALEAEESDYKKLPIGVFYEEERPTYESMDITLKKGPLIKQPMPTKEQIMGMLKEVQ
jgi:2-oxoglutarate/2-oxoacid ferredoxin oxidoreductase subunit beta